MVEGFKSVSLNIETYEILAEQAERNYRTIAAQIRFLVEQEQERVNAVELEKESA